VSVDVCRIPQTLQWKFSFRRNLIGSLVEKFRITTEREIRVGLNLTRKGNIGHKTNAYPGDAKNWTSK